MDSSILPCLIYGAQTWIHNKIHENKNTDMPAFYAEKHSGPKAQR